MELVSPPTMGHRALAGTCFFTGTKLEWTRAALVKQKNVGSPLQAFQTIDKHSAELTPDSGLREDHRPCSTRLARPDPAANADGGEDLVWRMFFAISHQIALDRAGSRWIAGSRPRTPEDLVLD